MKRTLKNLLLTLGVLVAIVLATLVFLVSTEVGARLVLSRMPPDFIVAESIDGRLIGPLVVGGVRLETASLIVTVERVELRWRPRGLFAGALEVDRLQADGVSVTSLESSAEAPTEDAVPALPAEISIPVAIRVQELLVRDFAYLAAPGAQPIVVDSLSTSLAASGSRFNIDRLDVSAPLFDLDAVAGLVARDDYPLDANIELALRPQEYATVRSEIRLTGSLELLHIEQTVAEPYDLEVLARIREPLQKLWIDIDATLSDVDLSEVSATLPPGILSARLRAQGPLSNLSLRTTVSGTYMEQKFSGELRSELEEEWLRVDMLKFELPNHDVLVGASGNVRLSGAFPMNASLQWQNLEWPLGESPVWKSGQGDLTLSGTLDDYTVSSNARLTLPGGVPMQAQVTGRGSREQADAELDLSVLDGRIEGRASASWQAGLGASVELDGRNVDPAAFSPDWPGQLDFTLRAQADVGQQEMRARLDTLTVAGRLRGQPVDVDGAGKFEAGEVTVERLRADFGATRLTAEGRYAETADMTWELQSDDLGELLPSASGTLSSRGTVSGTPPRVRIEASLDGSEIGFRENRIDSVALVADVDLTDQLPSRLDLRMDGIEAPAVAGESVSLEIDGRLSDHRVMLAADTSRGTAELAAAGRLENPWSSEPEWQFTLTDASIGYGELEPWRLRDAAQGSLSAARVAVNRHCWASGAASLCLEGQRTPESASGSFSLDALAFDYFAVLLPETVELDGTLSGRGEVSRVNGRPLQADLKFEAGDGRLSVKTTPPAGEEAGPAMRLLDLEPSRVSLTLDPETANAAVNLDFAQGRIDFEASLADAATPLMQRPLRGRLAADVPDVSFVAPFAPDVRNLTGQVTGRIGLTGTLARPGFAGEIVLADAALTSMAAGVRVEDITATIEGRADGSIGLDASMRAGGGSLELAGEVGFGSEPGRTTIEIDGEDFQLLGTEEARVFVSPDLEIAADSEAVRVTGVVRVPRADITPQNLPASAVQPSKDVLLVSPEGAPDGEPEGAVDDPAGRPVYADVQIVLGDEVRFEGFGLKARFEGDTTIVQQPDEPTSATGEITIAEGEYRAYGQGLVIESGKILFAGGPVTRPALDVRAVRRPEEAILVGTHVRGTLEEPEFTLFSEPSMTQQEQLSYLVLGRSLEEAPEGESSALAQASLALGVKGGNFLAENIGGNLGVDEFSIQSGSGEAGAASDPANAALVIGKYLSPKLYLSYGIGIFDPESVLTMEYEINRRLELVTESSSESTGADLVYSFDRGE